IEPLPGLLFDLAPPRSWSSTRRERFMTRRGLTFKAKAKAKAKAQATAQAIAFAVLACSAGAAFAAKTLVYCSEGSPEGFNPQYYTTGTTFDAVSVPMYNRLVEFEIGTTNVISALAESFTAAPDGVSYTFKLRPGVKFHSTAK